MSKIETQAKTAHDICLALTPDPIYGNKIKPTDKFLPLETAKKLEVSYIRQLESMETELILAKTDAGKFLQTSEALKTKMREKVALLNRLIRQHPESVGITTWLSMKEMLEKEFLGEEVTFEM